jgi:O-antigen/teichoic acid export membrane protein
MIKQYINKLLSSPTRKRLASGAIWGGVAAGGSRVVTVAASFFLARILGQVGFGEYGMVNSTAGMISSLAGMGIGLTVTKHVALCPTSQSHIVRPYYWGARFTDGDNNDAVL